MKRILVISLLAIVILSVSVMAQDSPVVSSLEISLWPEYDRPEVLIIHQGRLGEDVPLPAPVEFRIPARAGEPAAVAYVGEGGQRFNQAYTTRLEGDWLVISADLAAAGFQLEYYDELPVGTNGEREFIYTYVADYPITALSLEFQVPPTAEGFAVDPKADMQAEQGDGLTYHLVDAGALDAGEERSWTFSYAKQGPELTFQPAASAESAAQPPTSGATQTDVQGSSAVWIFLVAFVALLAVGVGAYWLGTRSQPPPPPPPSRSKRRGSGRASQPGQLSASSGGDDIRFCYTCGTGLRADSDFCHKCGSPVRTA